MAEGYVLTSALDVNDLLNQVTTQAATHGWTQHALGGMGTFGRRAHFSKDGLFVNLGASIGGQAAGDIIPGPYRVPSTSYSWSQGSPVFYPDVLAINVSTGYNGSLPWSGQPGAPTHTPELPNAHRFRTIRAKGAIGRVHMFFFEDPAAMFVVCEVRAGELYWFGAANMAKNRPWAGGQFYGASLGDITITSGAYPSAMADSSLRCTEEQALTTLGNGWGGYFSSPDRMVGVSSDPSTADLVPQYLGRNSNSSAPNDDQVSHVQRGYDPATGRIWPQPVRTYISRSGGGRTYLGTVPHVHFCTTSHFVGGEIVTIGGVQYMIFPWNWRQNPYDWDVTTAGAASSAEPSFSRNNTKGSGWALRLPS